MNGNYLTYRGHRRIHARMINPTEADMTTPTPAERLEYLRQEIRAERISWGELAELQSLAEHIEAGDVELLEWAGVPEFPDPLEAASYTLDRVAARLETLARAWREEADYMRNGDRSLLGDLPGREQRYADSASRSLLRALSTEVDRIARVVQSEIPPA